MTMAAVLADPKISQGIQQEGNILMHGPTFMGNPLACAVACASIDLLLQRGEGALYPQGWAHQICCIEQGLQDLRATIDHKDVKDVRILGGIGVVEMHAPVNVTSIQAALVSKGVWVRPFGNLIYIMPPYTISDEQLKTLCGAIIEVIQSADPA